MLFSSLEFIFLFLPAVLGAHYLVIQRFGTETSILFLIAASLVFYGAQHSPYIFLICGSIALNLFAAKSMGVAPVKRFAILIAAVILNLGLLAWFKYASFLAANLTEFTGAEIRAPNIVLPLAISFFTFQQIAFLVDLHKGEITFGGYRKYALFVLFFPQLIAGPIVRYQEIIPEFAGLSRRLKERLGDIAVGVSFFAIGLFKKNVLADGLSQYTDPLFHAASQGEVVTFGESWTAVLAFGFQIYFDFSAYSDMAIGLARMFGITLPINFNSPYKATSIVDFWRRWHMTLSRFLRDYLYIPLGGNRHGSARKYAAVAIVMLLGGLWHGAAWGFVLWGALHGTYIAVNHGFRALINRVGRSRLPRLPLFGWFLTFAATMIAWVPFRAADFEASVRIWRAMFGLDGLYLPNFFAPFFGAGGILPMNGAVFDNSAFSGVVQAFGLVGGYPILPIAAAVCFLLPNSQQWLASIGRVVQMPPGENLTVTTFGRRIAWQPTVLWAVALCTLSLGAIVANKTPQVFVYFQF